MFDTPIQATLDYQASLSEFIASATPEMINRHIQQQLSQNPVWVVGVAATEDAQALNKALPQWRNDLAQPGNQPIDQQIDSPFTQQFTAGEVVKQLDINDDHR